jgi:phage/conjugal plasmid C-4 type zinc finger TraR family protein
MATGWAGDGAVQDQIDATVKDAIKRARSRLPQGPGREHCEECDAPIPEARRKAVPGVRLCVACQELHDAAEAPSAATTAAAAKTASCAEQPSIRSS